MKKAKSATRPASKRNKSPTTVDEYVARVPEPDGDGAADCDHQENGEGAGGAARRQEDEASGAGPSSKQPDVSPRGRHPIQAGCNGRRGQDAMDLCGTVAVITGGKRIRRV